MKSIVITLIALLSSFSAIYAQSFYTQPSAVNTQDEIISIGWYPNPVRIGEKISVEVDLEREKELKTELVDALGKKVFELEASYPRGKSIFHIYTDELEGGLYFVRVSTENHVFSEKVVIE